MIGTIMYAAAGAWGIGILAWLAVAAQPAIRGVA